MRKTGSVGATVIFGLVVAGLVFVGSPRSANARPQYLSAFRKEYRSMKDQVKTVKCGVCHFGKKKTNRNDYGEALKKHLGKDIPKKGERDKTKINAALGKTEKDKSAVEGKTFGDLLKDKKLPGKNPDKK